MLCDAFGQFCTANSVARGIVAAARIISVEMWGQASATSTPSTVGVTWGSGTSALVNYGASMEASDTSTSTAYTPHVRVRPPKNSNAAFWQVRTVAGGALNTANVLTFESSIAGSIIDIVCEVVLYDLAITSAVPSSPSGATVVGSFAYPPLDGGGGVLIPIGVNAYP